MSSPTITIEEHGALWAHTLGSKSSTLMFCPFVAESPHRQYWMDGYQGLPFVFPRVRR